MSRLYATLTLAAFGAVSLAVDPAAAEDQPPLGSFYSEDHAQKSSAEMRSEEEREEATEYRHIPPLSADSDRPAADPYVRGRYHFQDDRSREAEESEQIEEERYDQLDEDLN